MVNDPPLTADPLMVARTAQGESCPGGRGPNGRVGVTPPGTKWPVTLQKSVWVGTVHIAVPSARPHPPTLLHSPIQVVYRVSFTPVVFNLNCFQDCFQSGDYINIIIADQDFSSQIATDQSSNFNEFGPQRDQ